MRTKHSMRKRLQSLAIHLLTQAYHLSYPCPPHHHPMMKKQSRHAHIEQVLVMIISITVVYEQGVGLKSSITADTAFRKDLPCRCVPTVHYRRRMLAHLSQLLPITGNHFMI